MTNDWTSLQENSIIIELEWTDLSVSALFPEVRFHFLFSEINYLWLPLYISFLVCICQNTIPLPTVENETWV